MNTEELMRKFIIFLIYTLLSFSTRAGLIFSVNRNKTTFDSPEARAVYTDGTRTTSYTNLSVGYDEANLGGN